MPRVHFAKSAPMVLQDTSIGEVHTPSDGEGMLQLEPSDFVNFCPITGDAKLTLKNVTDQPVVFKIQTTSPEKFRVRPRCGVVQPNCSAEVNIWLKSDQQLSPDAKDKFLVMATIAPNAECGSQEVADLWKERGTNDPDVENHRLVCRLTGKSKENGAKGEGQEGQGSREFGPLQLQEQNKEILARLKQTTNTQYVILVLVLLLFVGFGYLLFDRIHLSIDHGSRTCPKTTAFKCDKHK